MTKRTKEKDFSKMSAKQKEDYMKGISYSLCDSMRSNEATYEDLVAALKRVDPKISDDQILNYYGHGMFETR